MIKIFFTANKMNWRPVIYLALMAFSTMVNAQNKSVTGMVTDDAGEPLIGVNVLDTESGTGTATDFNGLFELEDLNEDAILVFSYIGYQTQEVPLEDRKSTRLNSSHVAI